MTQANLDLDWAAEQRLEVYLDSLAGALGRADRATPARAYCTGLLLPGERKSVEPMAARLEPSRVQAAHQSLHHLVAKADWSDEAMLDVVRAHALPAIERHGPIAYWIVDDTSIPKKGRHSVGVARQYCQAAVTLSVANEHASLPVAYRLYLPQSWAKDPERRSRVGVPEAILFQTKPEIALDQIRTALAAGISPGLVLMDAGYGIDTALRDAISALGLAYVAGIQSSTSLWPSGTAPLAPKAWSGKGRPPTRLRRTCEHQPASAKGIAQGLPPDAWRMVSWREGTNAPLVSRFAAVRVRPAHRDYERAAPYPEEWLLIEWPEGEEKPVKYWLSTLPAEIGTERLVAAAKGRWRIERDYQELKQEIGLGHYEGRGWRGFHHHASLCIAAYGFLVAERCLFPPHERFARPRQVPPLPPRFRPRGAGAT